MAKLKAISMGLLTLVFVGCGFKTIEKSEPKHEPEVTPATVDGRKIMKDPSFIFSIKAIEKGNLDLVKDKLPGQILVAGILTNLDEKSEEAKKIIVTNNPNLVDTREMSKEEVDVMMDITKRNTFINIGCPNIPKSETEGLIEIKPKIDLRTDFFHAHAQKVFICGKGQVRKKHTVVYAQEVHMDNSQFVFTKSKGLVNICAKSLILMGQNSITTIESEKNPVDPGSPVLLSVLESIEGTGQLHVNINSNK